MFFQRFFIKKIVPVFILFIGLSACSKKASVLAGTWLYDDQKLTKKTSLYINRGQWVWLEKCFEKSCRVQFQEAAQGYVPSKNLFPAIPETVTFVRDSALKESPDLNAKTLVTLEPGTRGYLMGEKKVWSYVDVGEHRGWALMENLYKGVSPFDLNLETKEIYFRFSGNWYIPFFSGERNFSLEKAFDGDEKTFGIIRKEDLVSVILKDKKTDRDTYQIVYAMQKNMNYKNLDLPSKMIISYPEKKEIPLSSSGILYSFKGKRVEFYFLSPAKEMIYLNGISIEPEEKKQEPPSES